MKPFADQIKQRPWFGWVIFLASMLITFLIGLLASSVMERRNEALLVYSPKTVIDPLESDSKVWGLVYPREYQSWLKTSDTSFKSKYNGNDPIDMLARDPRMVVLWDGSPFSKDYWQSRGHAYTITDIRNTLRTGAPMQPGEGPMPGTCWTCKSPDVLKQMKKLGIAEFYHTKWSSLGKEITHPIGCADCHDSKTMNLQITRPALIEAYQRMGKDIRNASQQEMRSLVCAQCHVEYYFKGDGKYLAFPWDKGLTADAALAYYDSIGFSDWTNPLSKAPMLKAQHPDYEISQTGIHAQRGVSCADCHMPYISEGGQKFTDHHIESPLNKISTSCQVCHRQSEAEHTKNVYERQDKIIQLRDKLEESLVMAHLEAKKAWESGAGDDEMKPSLQLIRKAQWFWDYAAASHGASFHSPLEVARINGLGIDYAQQARISLTRILAQHGITKPIAYPDLSSKDKSQRFIGLDMPKLKQEKEQFLSKVVPIWDSVSIRDNQKGY